VPEADFAYCIFLCA